MHHPTTVTTYQRTAAHTGLHTGHLCGLHSGPTTQDQEGKASEKILEKQLFLPINQGMVLRPFLNKFSLVW